MRELIGPILVHALLMFQENSKHVQMVAKRKLLGSLGNGLVDYILVYKEFNICEVEAKKEAIEDGVHFATHRTAHCSTHWRADAVSHYLCAHHSWHDEQTHSESHSEPHGKPVLLVGTPPSD
jgi:hypothetical protein